MAKSLFQSIDANIKKKRAFMISKDLDDKLDGIELKAEKQGVSFPLNEHVEAAIKRLVQAAEKELQGIDSEPQTVVSDISSSLSTDDILFQTNELED